MKANDVIHPGSPEARARAKAEARARVGRRLFLRGAGVTMALPFLESLPSFAATATAAGKAAPVFPKRLAVLFMGNGINGNHWWAKGRGDQMELGKSLAPVAAWKTKLNFISGLYNKPSTGVGIHPGQTGGILSGVPLQKGAVLKGGISFDQVLANAVGQETMQSSLVLGCEQPNTGYHETNFSMAYSSHISWSTPSSPVPMEVYPSLAFDSLFENRGSRRTQSILDRVREQAEGLARRASADDRTKLGEYLASVREIEKQVERTRVANGQDAAPRGDEPAGEKPRGFSMSRPGPGLPDDIRLHMQMMVDIVALAFQTDKTRIASLLLCRDLSGLFYPFLDVRDAHHPASHRDLTDDYERVTSFYCSQLGRLASKLDGMKEGDKSVLDRSCLLFLSNMWSGYKHDNSKLPVITVGGLDGALATGRVLDYLDKGDDNRRISSLYLSLMDRMGVSLPRFGDAERRLAGI